MTDRESIRQPSRKINLCFQHFFMNYNSTVHLKCPKKSIVCALCLFISVQSEKGKLGREKMSYILSSYIAITNKNL